MRFVISYDIVDDRRRERVARALDDYGDRVQHSVFEAELDQRHLTLLVERLKREVNTDQDSIVIYPLCATCVEKALRLGRNTGLDTRRAIVV